MDTTREKVYLAALLHDIGKFYQRADGLLSEKQNNISEESKKMIDYLCPLNEKGNFGYQHALWTYQFLQDKEDLLKKVQGLVESVFDVTKEDSLCQLAAYHHKPSTELQALISMADWWSAGLDRREKVEEPEGNVFHVSWGSMRYKKIPLYSVFNKIFEANYQYAFALRPLSIDEKEFFPTNITKSEDGVNEGEYRKQWELFCEEFAKLPTDSFDGFAESLMFLLKKYTWCVPSNTTDMANVSLFDHLKTTAAFADSLYVYKTEHPEDFSFDNNRLLLKEGVCPVILLGGDLSGIQKFIYNIASRKAAVSLKGRSFYLQLLIDSVIQRIISHPDICATLAHVVYSSGGKFYMILPNTTKVTEALDALKLEFEKELWSQHHGQLIINLDYVPFAYSVKNKGLNFGSKSNESIGELWRTLAEKLTNQKNQKFKDLLLDDYDNFFNEAKNKVGGETKVCAVTGIESSDCVPIDPKEEEKTYVLPIVKDQADLGNTLKDVDYILTHKSNEQNKYIGNRVKFDMPCVGVHSYLFDKLELTDDDAEFRKITSADVCRVKLINQTSFLAAQLKGNRCSYGFQFYGGNKQAQNEKGENKTFEQLADGSYLGVLRMDVDNLGSIFIKGLPDEDKSFAAYSTLSFLLDWFFSGFLNSIREKEEFKNDVNILYSGGDDLFAVGKWNKLIDFATEIREYFKRFVGRDDISISGGVAIVGDKYPISKAAELAGDAEDAAKKYNGGKKNAFSMFGESISWKDEFDYVRTYKKKFVSLIEDYGLPRGILHKVMTYAAIVKENQTIESENKTGNYKRKPDMSYLWHAAYYLTRFMGKEKDNKAVYDFCKDLRDKQLIKTDNYRLVSLAARWAELELKFQNDKRDEN
ncbi:MAG: type III-A CRISPR-associated protein Cas10/Csm1 [Paludibacteraceae bacterium]|nr:type III-A CRISPR-associated protein Cas10/Csm1 [Paludibacteraceae bacterium]